MTLKKKNLKLCLLVVAIVVTFPATAFAQGTSDTTVTTPLWVSLVAILVGYLTHAYQTGEVFGKKTLPKTYVPYVGALATFGTAFLAALPQGAPSPSRSWKLRVSLGFRPSSRWRSASPATWRKRRTSPVAVWRPRPRRTPRCLQAFREPTTTRASRPPLRFSF